MTDKYAAGGAESESEPGSGGLVLRNLLGITSPEEMDDAESAALLDATERLIDETDVTHRFTAADIRAMHRTWLGGIYPWAGEYRQVNMTKNGFPFANAEFIPRLMDDLERGELRTYTPCQFEDAWEQAAALAVVHAELVLIHPFREGNGRCSRLLAVLMGLQCGLAPLDFTPMEADQTAYIRAIESAQGRAYGPMAALFGMIVAAASAAQEPGNQS